MGGALMLALAACAVIAPPPGGPRDALPPILTKVIPDSGSSNPDFHGSVAFQFNEVVSEGSANLGLGTGALEKLIIVSPSEKFPIVTWQRRQVTVKPRDGWRPNTVYRIELLPGITDLRNNRSDAKRVVVFTTGGEAPTVTITGSAYDWTNAQPLRNMLVDATLMPDSLRYKALTDSAGKFSIGPLRPGIYVVSAVNDLNHNYKRDPREQFDSVRVGPDTLIVPELWTFPHDTAGPRLQTVARNDSTSATLTFSQPLDPRQKLDAGMVTVRKLPDSVMVRVTGLSLSDVYDSLRQVRSMAVSDSLRKARPDTTTRSGIAPPGGKVPPGGPPGLNGVRDSLSNLAAPGRSAGVPAVVLSRKALPTRLTVSVAQPWDTTGRYVIELTGIMNVNKVPNTTRNVLVIDPPGGPPAARRVLRTAKDSAAFKADSIRKSSKPVADSVRARADSMRSLKPPP